MESLCCISWRCVVTVESLLRHCFIRSNLSSSGILASTLIALLLCGCKANCTQSWLCVHHWTFPGKDPLDSTNVKVKSAFIWNYHGAISWIGLCMCVCEILTGCCLLAEYEYIANMCESRFRWRVMWFFSKGCFSTTYPFASFPSPSVSWLITLASFFPFPHFRLRTLPLTCTTSMVCPLPETRVQLSMVTRSVHS